MSTQKSPAMDNGKEIDSDPFSKERKLLLYFASTAHAYTHIVILAVVPLLPLIKSAEGGFDLTWRDSFIFAALPIFFFGLGAIPMGYIADRIGPLKVIFAGLIFILISITMVILAPNVLLFTASLSMLGLGSSFYHPAGLSLVSQIYTSARGMPMGIHGFLGNLGELSTPVISGIIGAIFGWRWAYILWFMVGLVILFFNIILLIRGTQDNFISNSGFVKEKTSTGRVFRSAFTFIIILAIIYALLFELAYRGTIQLIPFAAKSFQGLSAAEAAGVGGIIVTLLMLVGAAAQLAGGRMADRYGTKTPLFFLAFTAIIALLVMKSQAFSFELTVSGKIFRIDSLLIGAGLFGFGLFGTQPILNVIFAEATPVQIRGLFYGLMFFTKVGLASMALIGLAFIAEDTVIQGFYLLIVFVLGAAVIVLAMKESSFEHYKRNKQMERT